MNSWTDQNYTSATRMEDRIGQGTVFSPGAAYAATAPPGGLEMNLGRIGSESGNWPFSGYYGLMFDATDSDIAYLQANAKQ